MTELLLSDFVRSNGRLDYKYLRWFAGTVSSEEFAVLFRQRPVLVGSAIYSGELEHAVESGDNQTMLFNINDIFNINKTMDEASGLHQAIFAIYKRYPGDGQSNIITVGRSIKNDIVMNDYPISRKHAYLRIQGLRYFLCDLGTPNGTFINQQRLEPNKEFELAVDDEMGFGRYQFHFMAAEGLYAKIVGN